jgi:hypothetical protein
VSIDEVTPDDPAGPASSAAAAGAPSKGTHTTTALHAVKVCAPRCLVARAQARHKQSRRAPPP